MTHGFIAPGRLAAALLAQAALSAASCGSGAPDRLAVYPARGQVFVSGQPAANAEVFFHPASFTHPHTGCPQAEVDGDGWYTLSTYNDKDGAPAGEYAVTVVWPTGPKPPDEGPLSTQSPPPKDRLNGRFADPKTTPLRRTVKKGGGEIEAIRLD
jgi:hypothetical protein